MSSMKFVANRGLLKIFTALLLIVTIMFVSNYMVYRNSLSSIYDQVSENNKLVVKNMISAFDESFKDINNAISAIQTLPYNTWKTGADGSSRVDMDEVYMMSKDVKTIISPIDYVEEIVVFHSKSDLAITMTGTIHLQDLFRVKLYNQMYNTEFWKSFAKSAHTMKVFPTQWYSSGNEGGIDAGKRRLLAVAASNQLSSHNILVFLNLDKLLQHVNQTALMQGTSLTVLDQERNVLLNTEGSLDLVNVLNEINGNIGGELTLKKTGYEYNMYVSDYNGFTYVNKVPYQFANMNPVSKLNRHIIIAAIAFAIVLSGVLSLYLYKPMRIIFKLLGGRDPRELDLRSISAGIVKLKEENESYKARMDEVDADMAKSAFLDTLENRMQSREAELRMRRMFTENFKKPYFMLAAFHFKPAETGELDVTLEAGHAAAVIGNGLQESIEHTPVFQVDQDTFMAIIEVGSTAEREYAMKRLRSFVKYAEKEIWSDFDLLVTVSRLYSSKIEHCRKAYRDVKDGLAHRNVGSGDTVIDVQAIRHTWRVYFPLDEIEKLSHFLVSGNEQEWTRIIDDIFTKNVERRIQYHQLVPVAKMMFYDMVKLLDIGDTDPKAIAALEMSFNQKLSAVFRHEDIRDALVQAVKVIAENCKREGKSKLTAASVAQYIDNHYMKNLHLDHMAEQMETSPKYFSNYFKKTFGVNFVDYINKVRLSHAKELLKRTDMSVASIGIKIGYLNSPTFTSTFKKYYGISPSEYRRNLKE